MEGQFWWSKVNKSKVKARDARAINRRIRNAEEGSSKANTTIVVAIMRCGTAKNGRISRRNFSPRETDCPVHFTHTDWPLDCASGSIETEGKDGAGDMH